MTNRDTTQLTAAPDATPDTTPTITPRPATVSIEAVVYVALGVFVLLLYLLRLGIVPLTPSEITPALAAWQAVSGADVTAPASSALPHLARMFTLSALGTGEVAVRVPTALAAFALVFSPLLFRDVFGRARTLIMVVLLACSTVTLASARLSSPVVWQMLFGVLTLRALWDYAKSRTVAASVATAVSLAVTVLLTGATGQVVALVLLVAAVTAVRLHNSQPADTPLRDAAREWAWLPSLSAAALVTVIAATGMMVYPAGMDAVAQAVGDGLFGWIRPAESAPLFAAVLASLVYEPHLWLFGIIGGYMARRQDALRLPRPLLAHLGELSPPSLGFSTREPRPEHALWLTLPLMAGLASLPIEAAFQHEDGPLWYQEGDVNGNVFGLVVPAWSRWVIAGVTAVLLSLVLMHIGWLSRTLLTANFSAGVNLTTLTPLGAPFFFVVIMLLLFVLSGFTAASLYGTGATLRGGAIGVLIIVALFASLGSGWQVAVTRADDPRELWHTPALLMVRMCSCSVRHSMSWPTAKLAASPNLRSSSWRTAKPSPTTTASRGCCGASRTRCLSRPCPAPSRMKSLSRPKWTKRPNLRGNYVGQRFTLGQTWSLGDLTAQGVPAWWFQRQTQTQPTPAQIVVLWVRQDVYDGVNSNETR